MNKLSAKILKILIIIGAFALVCILSGCSRCVFRSCKSTDNFHSFLDSSVVLSEHNADLLASKLRNIVSPAIMHVEKWSGGIFVNKQDIIYACATHDSFQNFTRKGGMKAANTCNKIFVSPIVNDEEMYHVIKHELSHLYLEQHLGCANWYSIPAWLQEAIAENIANKNEYAIDKSKVVEMFKTEARKNSNNYGSIVDVYSKIQWGESRLILCDFLDYIDEKYDNAVYKYLVYLSNVSMDTTVMSLDSFLTKHHGLNTDFIYNKYINS